MCNYENIDEYREAFWFDSVKYYIEFPDKIYKGKHYVGNLIYVEDYEIEWVDDKFKRNHEGNHWHYKNKGKKGEGLDEKVKKSTRKNTDNQFTELLVALILLGLKDKYTYEDIIKFSNEMFDGRKLKCKDKEILDKYVKVQQKVELKLPEIKKL